MEKENQVIGLVKASSNILSQFYQDLAQPSVKAVGQALAIVFELCPTSLLSLKFWTEKRKLNFAKRLNEYKEKLDKISEEKRVQVDIQIGAPIIEKLTYTTNDKIADLFTTLLANASNKEVAETIHPAFIHIVSELCPDEALIIQYLYEQKKICYIKCFNYLFGVFDSLNETVNLATPKNKDMYYSHLISLGVIMENQRSYTEFSPSTDSINAEYSRIDIKIQKVKESFDNQFKDVTVGEQLNFLNDFHNVNMHNRGYYCLTQFGEFFAKACLT